MEYQIGDEELTSDAVVRAVSAVQGRDPCSLDPLSAVVEPDALDSLFADQFDGTPRTGGRLSFVYGSCRVTVDNGEYLTIEVIERLQESTSRSSASGNAE